MNSIEEPFAQAAHAAYAEGKFIAALATRMEYLRQRAKGFLESLGIDIGWTVDPNGPRPSLADEYLAESEALAQEVDRLGDDAQVELVAVKNIYLVLANTLSEISSPAPVDGERIARLLLYGMDMASMSYFCTRIDEMPAEVETAALAETQLTKARKQSESAERTNSKKRAWYSDAFVAHAAYLHLNPDKAKFAKRQAIVFAKRRTGIEREPEALKKAIKRHSKDYDQIAQSVRAVAIGEAGPADLRDTIVAALKDFGR